MEHEKKQPHTTEPSRAEFERRRVGRYRFYNLWAAHVSAGGDPSDEEWRAIAAECQIDPPARDRRWDDNGLGDFLDSRRR